MQLQGYKPASYRICVGNDFRIHTNKELYYLLNYVDGVLRINIQWLQWLDQVVRMEENVPANRVFHAGISERKIVTQSTLEEPNGRNYFIVRFFQ